MKLSKYKIASTVALFIGLMSAVAGSSVLFGITIPDYNILPWLVKYNIIMGVLSIVASVLIWQKHEKSKASSIIILATHASVLVLLLTSFSEVAATDSVRAMIFRLVVWIIIIVLILKPHAYEK